ncbi:predicted protein [Nematostella vectensis]|uniref:Tumor susceptibility gene 101 protein n=1 Tax=Nematostella vectensis TaxID=45351 RepID=A7SAT5_NEMVE|nr:tumor susceptibility gene 101 protein [Nematostella vectensis]EDO39177.1 predicted protein [Nematostella vectensis]|eukprot:XP_001631240.1 predicted protein [Nematostella vectensis]
MSWEPYLRDKLRKHPHAELCKRQILAAMAVYKDLRPSMQKFVHNDGRESELLSLDGTIPVSFRGSTYNIPVCIFLQETHPFIPPLVYVRPTSTMAIKVSKHVDNNGRVFLPYLTDWSHPRSEIAGLIQILCCVFAEEPPVYAKPNNYQPPPQPGYRPPYPGYPPTSSSATPYPATPHGMPMPMPGAGPGRPRQGYPPYQGYPPSTGTGATPYPHTTQGQNHFPTPPVPQRPYPASSGYSPVSQSNPSPMVETRLQSQPSISDDMIKASLLSAVEDKLRRKAKATFEQAQIELDQLNRTQEELKRGGEKLQDIVTKLQKEQADVENNINVLTQKNEEISDVIAKLESDTGNLQIDEAVVTTAPLYNQILNLFAEENAIEDTIYYLSEALRKEAVDSEVFLKQVRILSRKQFMIRALLQKARRAAGLGDVSGS